MSKITWSHVKSTGISIFLILFALHAVSCTGNRKRRKRRKKVRGIYHTVLKGQNLYRIAKTYQVDLEKIARINRIADVTAIKAGEKIFIPGALRVKKVVILKPSHLPSPPSIKKHTTPPKFIWPIKGKFTSSFGMRKNRKHDGVDIAAPKGTYIKASASGKVIFSGWGPKGYGKIVIIRHSDEFITVYAHNYKNIVKKGKYVLQGAPIAKVGSTGRSTGPHLHFEVRRNKVPKNPLKYLP